MGKVGVESAREDRCVIPAGRGCRHRVDRRNDDHAHMLLWPQWLSEKNERAGEKTDQQEDGKMLAMISPSCIAFPPNHAPAIGNEHQRTTFNV
ncbi:hypothetical protein [Mesorhizobium sp. B3-2-1]|uniref:hypothetical protein n=1 Tax=Mesorhizobium sp. B3-2-1 TaxID=2589891 RepID=UPI0015E3A0B4|nr:hypothetical protein [Mesorhizobium sp. B3-2-1]